LQGKEDRANSENRRFVDERVVSAQGFTVGVEEEYQLVDAESGALRGRARYVIAADWSDDIKAEMQEHTIEVETRVCEGTRCVRDDLARLRLQAAVAAEAEGVRVVAAGVHPFSPAEGYAFTDAPVYDELRAQYRALAETQAIFGMHVHVGVPEGVDRVRVANVARLYLPHLLALTASSPLYGGRDTGYASFRSLVWRRWPRSGPPPRLEDAADFERLIHWLRATGSIDAPGRIYWELRPHHAYPTIEFRVADVTPRLDDAVAAAALARAIVAGVADGTLREPELPATVLQAMLGENSWRASRDGTDAEFVDLWSAEPRVESARAAIGRLADQLAPHAERLGDAADLAHLATLLERGGAAGAIRRRAEELEGDLAALVRWMADETVLGVGLDRRANQRAEITE
jgi:carboxylate-amine ligase